MYIKKKLRWWRRVTARKHQCRRRAVAMGRRCTSGAHRSNLTRGRHRPVGGHCSKHGFKVVVSTVYNPDEIWQCRFLRTAWRAIAGPERLHTHTHTREICDYCSIVARPFAFVYRDGYFICCYLIYYCKSSL